MKRPLLRPKQLSVQRTSPSWKLNEKSFQRIICSHHSVELKLYSAICNTTELCICKSTLFLPLQEIQQAGYLQIWSKNNLVIGAVVNLTDYLHNKANKLRQAIRCRSKRVELKERWEVSKETLKTILREYWTYFHGKTERLDKSVIEMFGCSVGHHGDVFISCDVPRFANSKWPKSRYIINPEWKKNKISGERELRRKQKEIKMNSENEIHEPWYLTKWRRTFSWRIWLKLLFVLRVCLTPTSAICYRMIPRDFSRNSTKLCAFSISEYS